MVLNLSRVSAYDTQIDGRTLLITASDTHDRAEIRAKGPSGALYTARVAVAGGGLPSVYGVAP